MVIDPSGAMPPDYIPTYCMPMFVSLNRVQCLVLVQYKDHVRLHIQGKDGVVMGDLKDGYL